MRKELARILGAMRALLVLLFVASPAMAEAPPACAPARAGQTACLAGRLCVCGFERGGSLAGRPDRWAWDCGILRPDCRPAPAESGPPPSLNLPGLMIAPPIPPRSSRPAPP